MAYPFSGPTPESCWERHPENFPRLIPARVRGGLPGSALNLRLGATSRCLPSPSFAAPSRAAEGRVGCNRLPKKSHRFFELDWTPGRDTAAGVRGSLGPGVSHGWEQERAGESARMNDVRSAQGAGWRGREGGPAVNRAARCPGLRRSETPPSAPPESPGARFAATRRLRPGAERLPRRARPAQSLQLSGPVPPGSQRPASAPRRASTGCVRAVSAGPGGGWAAGCASCGARGGRGSSGDVALTATASPRPPRPGHPSSVFICWGSAGGCLSSQPAVHSFVTPFRALGSGIEMARVKP